ncbi:C-type lectin 37Da-like [Neocloeon triangulifer]|uniref:C-type lectin 37Da-like n=1 Tax=Neocloeon triangulifer TaxID=2078957 RepID=UPI00286F3A10|nr:C-type lectin 37Da-like [Neocloeon triangulifer]
MKEQSRRVFLAILALCKILGFVDCQTAENNCEDYSPPLLEEHVDVLSELCKMCSCKVEVEKLASQKRECDLNITHLMELNENAKKELNLQKEICDFKIKSGLKRKLQMDEKNLLTLSTGRYFVSPPSQSVNWFEAARICKTYGMELVSIETKEENDEIRKMIDSQLYWISGSDMGSEGEFYWTGTGRKIETFTNYREGQPDNYMGKEHCLYLKMRNFNMMWNDSDCEGAKMRFICEMQME